MDDQGIDADNIPILPCFMLKGKSNASKAFSLTDKLVNSSRPVDEKGINE